MRVGSTDGFGREQGSWGIVDDRGTNRGTPATFYTHNQVVHVGPRKLREGDCVSVVCNTDSRVCLIVVNNFEFGVIFKPGARGWARVLVQVWAGGPAPRHAREQPRASAADDTSRRETSPSIWYGATLSNDSRLELCAPYVLRGDPTGPQCPSSEEQYAMPAGRLGFDREASRLGSRSWLGRLRSEAQYLSCDGEEWLSCDEGSQWTAPSDPPMPPAVAVVR